MEKKLKKTRNCIEPWRSVQFEAGGTISPCCSGTVVGNFGNINTDWFDAVQRGQDPDVLENADYRMLRQGLLTGKLPKSCITCRSVHDKDITTEELRQRVVNHLASQGVATDGIDLTKAWAFYECGGNITNRCNFSCVYCAHSGENGHSGFLRLEMDRDRFLAWIDFLCNKGLKIFNFCGIGELSAYPGWQDLCDAMLHRHPHLRLRVISNFGKPFTDSELDTLAKLELIHVSCDTLEPELYAWLRRGGRLPVLLENIRRLKTRFSGNPSRDPRLVFNVTATDAIVDKLEGLFRFAAGNNMFVHLSNLFVMEGSVASKTDCVRKISDMPESRMPHIREILWDLPRRMKAQNPLTHVWEYKFLYNSIMEKADAVTFNKFVPRAGELIYGSFYASHPRNPDACLRNLWTSFDDVFRGIYIRTGKNVEIGLPGPGKLSYRAVWCRERPDGNLEALPGPAGQTTVAGSLVLSAELCGPQFENMLFEVLSFDAAVAAQGAASLIAPAPPEGAGVPILVREAFLLDEEETVIGRLVDSQEPIVIWCAGLRTLRMLSNTRLAEANIRMIIDGNRERKGESFCGRAIHSPEDIGEFTGKIVIIHASCPEQVELDIRQMGIPNEILIL